MLAIICVAASALLPRLPPPRMSADSVSLSDLKRSILDEAASPTKVFSVAKLVAALEAASLEDDLSVRPAASPLVDGLWETVWVSEAPRWTERWPLRRGQPLTHEIRGGWTGLEAGYYMQRVGGSLVRGELRAAWSELGGEDWNVEWQTHRVSVLGTRVWGGRALRKDADYDYNLRPTFVDGELCVLRSPAVVAAASELRAERIYVLRRLRHALWNGDDFVPPPPKWLLGAE